MGTVIIKTLLKKEKKNRPEEDALSQTLIIRRTLTLQIFARRAQAVNKDEGCQGQLLDRWANQGWYRGGSAIQ